jgi:hypothetical protein
VGIALLLFFNEPGLCGVAVETDGQVCDFLDNIVAANLRLTFFQLTYIEGSQLYLVKNFIFVNPKVFMSVLRSIQLF